MALLSHPFTAVVVLLGVLVFVHEFGHYLVGRFCGIAVETFSIGFGPRIFGFTRHGTEYRISWIPLGGYVKFAGAHPAEDVPEGLHGIAFRDAGLLKRAMTVFAGPLCNFVLAVFVYMVLGMAGISHPPAVIGEVIEGSPAEQAGIRFGDKFAAIDGEVITYWRDLERIISQSAGKKLSITIQRGAATQDVQLTPAAVEVEGASGKRETIGRAGVALGRQPAVIAVLAADTAAHAAGLKTADKIVAVEMNGASRRVLGFSDFGSAVVNAVNARADLKVKVIDAPRPSARDEEKQNVGGGAFKTLATAALTAASPDVPTHIAAKAYMKQLGIRDAQLAVAEATETLKDVLKPRDVLVAFNDQDVRDIYNLREMLIANQAATAKLTIIRGFETVTLNVSLKGVEAQKPEGLVTIYMLPVLFWGQPEEPDPLIEQYDTPLAALGYGMRETWAQTVQLVENVKQLISGNVPLKALGGPMLIAMVAGESAKRGWRKFIDTMALISINLGLLNLFPIPVLDGGQLMLMGAEAVRRRPLREAAIENFQKVGFAMILALVVLATYNDLSRFWKSMLGSIVGLFQ